MSRLRVRKPDVCQTSIESGHRPMRVKSFGLLGFLALLVDGATCGGPSVKTPVPADSLVIMNCTIVDGTGGNPGADGLVVIHGEPIVGPVREFDDPSGARMVDAQGGPILPGLIDSHVHFAGPAIGQLRPKPPHQLSRESLVSVRPDLDGSALRAALSLASSSAERVACRFG